MNSKTAVPVEGKPELRKSEVWKASFENTTIEIIRWSFESEARRLWKEKWNYYVYLYEKYCKDFESLWLPDKVQPFHEGGAEYVSHAYNEKFGDVEMHGGITFYAKHGYSKGHRCVQIGCDFQHYGDEGQDYSVEYIYFEALATARECIERFYIAKAKGETDGD